ncbi:hypothetical protein CGA22_04945 [Pseudomonas sp. PSB18]|nr:hypothetical protein [Pseudomonas sp. PSB18]
MTVASNITTFQAGSTPFVNGGLYKGSLSMSNKLLILASTLLMGAAAHAQAACDATLVQDLIGKKFDAATEKDAKARAGADLVRSTPPGEGFLIKNLNNGRLSIMVDKDGNIASITCN